MWLNSFERTECASHFACILDPIPYVQATNLKLLHSYKYELLILHFVIVH